MKPDRANFPTIRSGSSINIQIMNQYTQREYHDDLCNKDDNPWNKMNVPLFC